jgi:hypothetical protein
MEIKELVSFYINETSQTLEVTFRIRSDNEDEIRTDQIELEESKTFGYILTQNKSDNFYEEEEEEEEEEDYFDEFFNEDFEEEEIISFLNEYYLIYPKRLPDTQLF